MFHSKRKTLNWVECFKVGSCTVILRRDTAKIHRCLQISKSRQKSRIFLHSPKGSIHINRRLKIRENKISEQEVIALTFNDP